MKQWLRIGIWLLLWIGSLPMMGQRVPRFLKPVALPPSLSTSDTLPWTLIFSDEFDGDTLNTTKWTTWYPTCEHDHQIPPDCVYARTHDITGIKELQIYRDDQVEVQEGKVILTADRKTTRWQGTTRYFTSGMIHTRKAHLFKYGRVEIRCKLPKGRGFWPAAWLWGDGEIDLFEVGGDRPRKIFTNVHGKDIDGEPSSDSQLYRGPNTTRAFHVYTVEWDSTYILWKIDGKLIRRMDKYHLDPSGKRPISPNMNPSGTQGYQNLLVPHGIPRFKSWLILNLAIDNGTFTDAPNKRTRFPAQMEIDYVRIYQQKRK